MGLAEYRRKRNFAATPEPSGGGTPDRSRTFVVQLHHASHRHYDFRLEIGGVLKSWAVPKGPSFDPSVKRMAMAVEDHPLSYASFEGDIPEGNYGAGHVDIFDEGTWTPDTDLHEGLRKGELRFTMHGDVLRGAWILARMRKERGRQPWLLIKQDDAYAGKREADDFVDPRTGRPIARRARRKVWPEQPTAPVAPAKARTRARALPRETLTLAPFAPELCRSRDRPPAGSEWLHEAKWDGYRILATVVGRKVALWSRNGLDWTDRLADVAAALKGLGAKSAQFDGELIVIRKGHADFNALQARLSGASHEPLHYLLFDLPHLNGASLRDVPLVERKARLKALLEARPQDLLGLSEHQVGNGAEVFAQATRAGVEGIVSKRVDSGYSGARSGAWVKVKGRPSDEFVVIGYTPPKGARAGIGALLLAKPGQNGWRYVGRVGTGMDNALLADLLKKLKRIHTPDTDADLSLLVNKDIRIAQWVKPSLVVEVFFQGIGGQGLLRQPAWKALREDKSPADLRAAPAAEPTRKTGRRSDAAAAPPSIPLTSPDRVVYAERGRGRVRRRPS